MRPLPTLTVCGLVLAATALAAGPLAAETEPEAGDAAPAEAEEAAAPTAPRTSGRGGEGWWNDPRIAENLSLSEAQREKMDGHLATFRSKSAPPGQTARNAFVEALAAGDWEAARKALGELEDQMGRPVLNHGELKIEVLSILSDEQRAKLAESYPRLIGQPWVRMGRRGGPRRPPR